MQTLHHLTLSLIIPPFLALLTNRELQLHNVPFQTYIDEAELQIADSWQTENNVKCLLMTFRSTLDRRFKRLTLKLKVEDQRNVEINLRWAGHNGGLLGGLPVPRMLA
jgi:hypothetical protein